MAREPKSQSPGVKAALRKAFKAVEAEPVPTRLSDHVERLAGPKRRPDGRS